MMKWLIVSLGLMLTSLEALEANNNSTEDTDDLPPCPRAVRAKYHYADQCVSALAERQELLRVQARQDLLDQGMGVTIVPNQETIVCPFKPARLQPFLDSASIPKDRQGLNQLWLVENLSPEAIAVYLVYSNGQEVSSVDPLNPKHVTKIDPGDYRAISAYEGHVFHVRNYHTDTLMLQHRVGLIPIRSTKKYDCRKTVVKTIRTKIKNPKTGQTEVALKKVATKEPDLDNEPLVEQKSDQTNETVVETNPSFARTPTHKDRKCHTIDIGFRNEVGCPVNLYWAGALRDIPISKKSCNETFRMHLGTLEKTQDFMKDWKSSTKWEGTMIGHTFVARLKRNESIVVDHYTLEPTRVYDCRTTEQQQGEAQEEDSIDETNACASTMQETSTLTSCEQTNPKSQEQRGLGHHIRKWLDNGRMDRHYL